MVAQRYFEALASDDWDTVNSLWADGAFVRVVGKLKLRVPDEWRAFTERVRRSFPDVSFELLHVSSDGELAAARWRITGTFDGEPFEGVEPTGRSVELEAREVVRVRDRVIDRSNVFLECSALAAQLGTADWMIAEAEAEPVADGVWVLRGGYPLRAMNVFLIRDRDGAVTVFDAGTSAMAQPLKAAAERIGPLKQVVLGHGHSDHRGSAKALGAPVLCHPDEVTDAEGDGGAHYMDLRKVATPARWVMATLVASYDGPPPTIAGTVSEGDEVAGFTVVELPGHAPGLIGLWRDADRLAIVSDCFYLTDMDAFGKPAPAQIPHRATTFDYELARASIRKLAALEPAAAWPGHLGPISDDVRAVLEHAAAG
ncbi:MAG TPA: ester cyclase [Solirubrobacteraceae bacterium]|nr:ester cyclase [Solirubrobacteraceae bacterium]